MGHFQFEQDFVATLRCIPLSVRFKLDTVGIKLRLNEWHRLSYSQRETLVQQDCRTPVEITQYRHLLRQWITEFTGAPPETLEIHPQPAWEDDTQVPVSVQAQAPQLTLAQWAGLSSLQRFALIKLSRSNHENHNFPVALAEFGIAR